ncbi:MAG TPA: M13 family metallopeptidase [Chitinophagales bacterium]|nr:M13 family metallopeptidase [Chitinophagales bacterium]
MNLKRFVKYALASGLLVGLLIGSYAFTFNADDKGKGLFKPEDFNQNVKPGDDFFMHVNGGWYDRTAIPSTEARWGSFNEVDELRYKVIRKILDDAAADKADKEGTARRKVGDYYRSGMDSVALNRTGLEPVRAELKRLDDAKTIDELLNTVAWFNAQGAGMLYGAYVYPDLKNSMTNAFYLSQSGLGLPDRDFYFREDTASVRIRNEYVKYVASNLRAIGYDDAKAKTAADNIMQLETALAEKSMDRVTRRNPYATYNKMTLKDLSATTSNINWESHLKAVGVKQVDSVIVGQPEYFKQLDAQLKATPLQTWKDYLKAHHLEDANPFLDDASMMRTFGFRGKVLTGTKEPKPRWKRVMGTIEGTMGEALGEEYVKVAFTPESKKRMLEMIENMRTAFAKRIDNLDWMSASTKEQAHAKLKKIAVKVGYPDKWRDYSAVTIDNSYYGNVSRAGTAEYKRMLDKLGKPVDRTEWGMNAYTVNAYYSPLNNEIVFPAGILQAPFFDANADDAVIYGGIGAVICHELTHGFDDQGSKYDADGNLRKWWTDEDEKRFQERTKKVEDQFAKYTVLDDLAVNGKLTLGENIADLGGVQIALDALKQTEQYKKNEKIDGFTPEQRFFLNWARVWRTKYTDAALRNQIQTNPHSPGHFRCNGPLTNVPEWYTAFNVKEGDKWYVKPEDRAKIW